MRWMIFMLALLASACGANEAANGPPESTAPVEPRSDSADENPRAQAPADPPVGDAPPPVAEEQTVAAEPEAEPIDVEAGVRLGPIRIGMSREDVEALGLEEVIINPRTTQYGRYQISYRDGVVRRAEALIGELERIRFGERVLEAGTHISEIRDAFGDCTWTEGGGERYSCANGTLHVRTTHTMDPQRYTVGVSVR